jgi:glycosyltransferase involved in cell wall biosynthesis
MKLIYAFPEPLPIARARGLQAASTVAALARLGVEVDLYHVPGAQHPLGHYGIETPPGLRPLPLSRSLPWPLHRVHSNRLFAARLLRATHDDLAGNVVMVRHLKLASMLLERRPGVRLVYEAHEVFSDTARAEKSALRRAEEGLVMRHAAAVVCNSGATAARLSELHGDPRRLEVIPNGVDWPARAANKRWDEPGRHIVYAGSLFPWKGAADLVSAASGLPGCRIELVGGESAAIRDLSQGAPRTGAELLLTGPVPHAEVLERLAKGCIAVLPNRAGVDSAFTSPIKLFEYMAAGCAIVATDLPAIREILADDEAEWAAPGDPASLARAIAALAGDPVRARGMGHKVREKARRYTWDARAGRLEQLFR